MRRVIMDDLELTPYKKKQSVQIISESSNRNETGAGLQQDLHLVRQEYVHGGGYDLFGIWFGLLLHHTWVNLVWCSLIRAWKWTVKIIWWCCRKKFFHGSQTLLRTNKSSYRTMLQVTQRSFESLDVSEAEFDQIRRVSGQANVDTPRLWYYSYGLCYLAFFGEGCFNSLPPQFGLLEGSHSIS